MCSRIDRIGEVERVLGDKGLGVVVFELFFRENGIGG